MRNVTVRPGHVSTGWLDGLTVPLTQDQVLLQGVVVGLAALALMVVFLSGAATILYDIYVLKVIRLS